MRLKQFILQEDRSKIIKENEAIEIIKKNCKQALNKYKKKIIIYRGIERDDDFLSVDPKSGKPRKSANTKNYYTLINDNSPYWKEYPKRSQSIICSTTDDTTMNYGYTYIVFPYDNAKIGVCYQSDYWDSFPHLFKLTNQYYGMGLFNRHLDLLFEQVDIPLSDKSYSSLQHSFGLFDLTFDHDTESIDSLINDDGYIFLKGYDKVWDLMKHLNNLLAPKPNKFGLYKISNLSKYEDREVWTDSKSILIQLNKEEILSKL
jgi:hypothetical protein